MNFLQTGNEKGFDIIFKLYHPELYYFAFRYVKDRALADDIVQNCFIKLWERRVNFTRLYYIKAYLYKIVYYACLDSLKGGPIKDKPPVDAVANEESALHQLIRSETLGKLYTIIDRLPPAIAMVIKMIYIEGRTVAETAQALRKSIPTIKSQKARGLEIIRAKMPDIFLLMLSSLLLV